MTISQPGKVAFALDFPFVFSNFELDIFDFQFKFFAGNLSAGGYLEKIIFNGSFPSLIPLVPAVFGKVAAAHPYNG